jgi:hypothetical protein
MRKGIARKMTQVKQTVPHAYTIVEVDMGNVTRWREANQAAYRAREGIGISYVAVVVKAVTSSATAVKAPTHTPARRVAVRAQRYPQVNAQLASAEYWSTAADRKRSGASTHGECRLAIRNA